MKQTWLYTIKNEKGIVLKTSNAAFAEEKSRHGYLVHCKRMSHVFRYQ